MSCAHLAEAALPAAASAGSAAPEGCTDCLAAGLTGWVHLRECLTCGHVACCDSSPWRHASAHFGHTAHPVVRSAEPGETWRWCYLDEHLG